METEKSKLISNEQLLIDIHNTFVRAHDQYLNPPDEPEAVHCNDCGEEMEDGETCKYQWCPGKFEGVAAEMANELVEALAEVKTLKAKVKRLEMKWIS